MRGIVDHASLKNAVALVQGIREDENRPAPSGSEEDEMGEEDDE